MTKEVRPKGSSGGDYNSLLSFVTALNAGSVSDTDIVFSGAFGAADFADFPNTGSATAAITNNGFGNGAGPVFGTSQVASSTASGKTFRFSGGANGRGRFDARGMTGNASRQRAVLTFRGENITLIGSGASDAASADRADVIAADQNYLQMGIAYNNNPDAETQSFENCGVMMLGNGNTYQSMRVWGGDGFSRIGLYMGPSNLGVAASNNKTNTVVDCEAWGSCTTLQIEPQGSGGYDMRLGQKLFVSRNYFHHPCWGRLPTDSAVIILPYNAARHGNAVALSGVFNDVALVYNNEATGGFQDLFECGISHGVTFDYNYAHDSGDYTTQDTWRRVGGTTWARSTETGLDMGNGAKFGLSGKDGTPPSYWLGTDGVAGGQFNVDEARNICTRFRAYRLGGVGITSNHSNGLFVGSSEIIDTLGHAMLVAVGNAGGHFWLQNNFFGMSVNARAFQSAMYVEANANLYLYNNVFRSFATGGSYTAGHKDATISAGSVLKAHGNNLWVTNRRTVSASATFNNGSDLATPASQSVAWNTGTGWGVGSEYLTGGTATPYSTARTFGSGRNMNNSRFNLAAPPVGPY